MAKEYKIKGNVSTRRKLIKKLQDSSSLFERLQKVTKNSKLKKKFGNSINNISDSIEIIGELELDEIELLVNNMRINIKNEKSN